MSTLSVQLTACLPLSLYFNSYILRETAKLSFGPELKTGMAWGSSRVE